MNNNLQTVSLLSIGFTMLKLTSVIDWSWWWVISPLWIWFLAEVFVFYPLYLLLTRKERKNLYKAKKDFEDWKKDNNSDSRFQYKMHQMMNKNKRK